MGVSRLLDWVEKATFTVSDIDGAGDGGYLSPAQARQFLKDAITPTAILSRADVFDSDSPIFEVPKLSFNTRIMRGGTEGSRLDDADRTEPDSSLVTLTTQLFKGEVPVTDEVFEDNVERAGLADSLMGMIAEAVGRDLEQIAIQSDSDDADTTFGLTDGICAQLVDDLTGQEVDASAFTSAKQTFKEMFEALPAKYRGQPLVFYVPTRYGDAWADENAGRGTVLGDSTLTTRALPPYRGIEVVEVPLLTGTQNSVNYGNYAILADPKNLKVGFHRRVRMEKFRDPREGVTSFIPTVRFDVKWAKSEACVIATGLPTL